MGGRRMTAVCSVRSPDAFNYPSHTPRSNSAFPLPLVRKVLCIRILCVHGIVHFRTSPSHYIISPRFLGRNATSQPSQPRRVLAIPHVGAPCDEPEEAGNFS